jgi:hypothetical protein
MTNLGTCRDDAVLVASARSNGVLTLLKDTVMPMAFREKSDNRLTKSSGNFKTTASLARLGTRHSYNSFLRNKDRVIPCSAIL